MRRLALVVLALAAVACGGADPGEPYVEAADGRVGPAGVEPAYTVLVPEPLALARPRAGVELRATAAGSALSVGRTAPDHPLDEAFARALVADAVERGRERALLGEVRDITVDGAPAITFAQTDATDGEQRIGTVVVDHAGTRFVIALAARADAYDPVLLETLLASWRWSVVRLS